MSNIEKIQKMVKGIYHRPLQTGYEGKTVQQRKEGEEWTDARGRSWKIEDGKRKQITKIPPRGFDKCNDCEKLILKTIDQQTYNRMGRCKYCQIDFENKLRIKGEYEEWEKSKVKALEKIANVLDALTLWFEDIDKEEWSNRTQWYLAEYHKKYIEEDKDK